MRYLLICNGGVSTSILAANIKKYMPLSDEIKAMPLSSINDSVKDVDIILIAPQIQYIKEQIQADYPDSIVVVINEKAYGKMDGKTVYVQAQEAGNHIKKKGEKIKMKKLKITLCCNGGVSTKMLCKKIIAAAEKKGFEIECDAYSTTMIDAAVPGSDLLLMGPQIKFMANTFKERFPDIPVEVIGMREYGSMNGEKIFDDMLAKYNW